MSIVYFLSGGIILSIFLLHTYKKVFVHKKAIIHVFLGSLEHDQPPTRFSDQSLQIGHVKATTV